MSSLEELQAQIESERQARAHAEQQLQQQSAEVKLLNQKLQTSAEQLRRQVDRTDGIVQTTADGLVTYDASGRITTFNRAA